MTPNPTTALQDVADAIRRLLTDRGLIPTGEIHLVAPREPGRVEVEATIHDQGSLARLTLVARPVPGAPAPAAAPAEPHPPAPLSAAAPLATLAPAATDQLRHLGYSGNVCVTCGGTRMRRRGTCETCEDCGATSGCG